MEPISIKLIIDESGAIRGLKVVDSNIQQIASGLSGIKTDKAVMQLNGLIKASFNTEQSFDESVKSIQEFIVKNDVSEQVLSKVITRLNEEKVLLGLSSQGYVAYNQAINKLATSHHNIVSTQASANRSFTQGNMAVQALGYTVSDVNMFMVDWQMGMRSISNNLPVLGQYLRGMGQEAKDSGLSLKDYLLKTLSGPGGVVLGVSAAALALEVLPSLFKKTNEAAKEAATDGLKKFNDELGRATSEQILQEEKYIKRFLDLQKKRDIKTQVQSTNKNFAVMMDAPVLLSENEENEYKLLKKQYTDKYGEEGFKELIKSVKGKSEEIRRLKKTLYGDIDLRVSDAEKKLKEFPIDGKESDRLKLQKELEKLQAERDKLNKSTKDKEEEILKLADQKIEKILKQFESEKTLREYQEDYSTEYLERYKLILEMKLKEKLTDEQRISVLKTLAEIQDKQTEGLLEDQKKFDEFYQGLTLEQRENVDSMLQEIANKPIEAEKKSIYERRILIDAEHDETKKKLLELDFWKDEELRKHLDSEEVILHAYAKRKEKIIEESNKKNSASMNLMIETMTSGVNEIFNQFLSKQRQAKDEWDAVWLSMKNSALRVLSEIINDALANEIRSLFSGKSGGSDKEEQGTGIGDVIKGVLSVVPFLAEGGVVTRPTLSMIGEAGAEAVIPLAKLDRYINMGNSIANNNNIILKGGLELDLNKLRVNLTRIDNMYKDLT